MTSAPTSWKCQCGVDVPMGCSHTCAHIGPVPSALGNPPWPSDLIAAYEAELKWLREALEDIYRNDPPHASAIAARALRKGVWAND